MKLDIFRYNKMLSDDDICIIYSGPMWSDGIDGMAESLQLRLDLNDLPPHISQCVFSVFVEQVNNIIMYSAEKERFDRSIENKHWEVSRGVFILGLRDNTYFVQSGNLMDTQRIEKLKSRLDYLNTLGKQELRQYYREQMKSENEDPESKGAGIGLIEIARRATSKIEYDFEPYSDDLSYFTMRVAI